MNELEATPLPPEEKAPLNQRLILFVIAAGVILLDQFSKMLVEQSLPLYEVWAPFPAYEAYFRILHATNTGIAFGLFPEGSPFFAIMAIIVSGAIIYYNYIISAGHRWFRIALGLTLGGALGNFIDRVRIGHVTDFLDFGPWPIFNVADMAVVGGAILLGWLVFLDARAEKRAVEAEQAQTVEMSSADEAFLPRQAASDLHQPLNEPE